MIWGVTRKTRPSPRVSSVRPVAWFKVFWSWTTPVSCDICDATTETTAEHTDEALVRFVTKDPALSNGTALSERLMNNEVNYPKLASSVQRPAFRYRSVDIP